MFDNYIHAPLWAGLLMAQQITLKSEQVSYQGKARRPAALSSKEQESSPTTPSGRTSEAPNIHQFRTSTISLRKNGRYLSRRECRNREIKEGQKKVRTNWRRFGASPKKAELIGRRLQKSGWRQQQKCGGLQQFTPVGEEGDRATIEGALQSIELAAI